MTKIKDQIQENLAIDLVTFIYIKFIAPISINGKEPSDRKYQEITSIGRTTINKIKKREGYDVPFSTISRVCKYAEISLTEFFTMFEAYLQEKEAEVEEKK